MAAEEHHVSVDEACLAHSAEELTGRHRVEATGICAAQLAAAGGHGARRHQYHVDTGAAQGGDIVDKRAHARDVEVAVGAGEYVAAYFYGDSHSRVSARSFINVSKPG